MANMALRSIGSISSELCEMQRLRDSNIALGAKDLEWQRRIISSRPPPAPTFNSPPRRLNSSEPTPFSLSQYIPLRPPLSPRSPPIPVVPAPNHLTLPEDTAKPQPSEDTKSQPSDFPLVQHLHPDDVQPLPRAESPTASIPSGSTHPEPDTLDAVMESVPIRRGKKRSASSRPVGKIRRHRMTKEEEARFAPEDLVDLTGSTAAKSRKMTVEERDIMLHKRRLRNRQSAARSRDKQRKTIADVGDEVDDLLEMSEKLRERCELIEKEMSELRAENEALRSENNELKRGQITAPATVMGRNGSTLRFSMSSEMLDKIIGNSGVEGKDGLLRIPSKLHVSVSTDRLADGCMPALSGSIPSLSRNVSVIERLLDLSNNQDEADTVNNLVNTSTTDSQSK